MLTCRGQAVLLSMVFLWWSCQEMDDLADSGTVYSIRDYYWSNRIDQDQDGWACRGSLMVEVDESGSVPKTVRVSVQSRRMGQTDWAVVGTNEREMRGEEDDAVSIECRGPDLARGMFEFSVLIEVFRDSELKWSMTAGPSVDPDLRNVKFESSTDDQFFDP